MNINTISDSEIIQGLEAKKHVIKSQINELKKQIAELNNGLTNIDTTILFLTGGNIVSKNKRNVIFKPNECKILVLDYLRTVGEVVTSRQIAESIATAVSFDMSSDNAVTFQNSIVKSLRNLESKGIVRQVPTKNRQILSWALVN